MARWFTLMIMVALGACALGLSRCRRVVVEGRSMAPTLSPGDRLLVWETAKVGVDDIVVVRDPREPTSIWVKRVHRVTTDGLDVRGDAPRWSTDSRQVGVIPRELVVGRMVRRYARAATSLR